MSDVLQLRNDPTINCQLISLTSQKIFTVRMNRKAVKMHTVNRSEATQKSNVFSGKSFGDE